MALDPTLFFGGFHPPNLYFMSHFNLLTLPFFCFTFSFSCFSLTASYLSPFLFTFNCSSQSCLHYPIQNKIWHDSMKNKVCMLFMRLRSFWLVANIFTKICGTLHQSFCLWCTTFKNLTVFLFGRCCFCCSWKTWSSWSRQAYLGNCSRPQQRRSND